MARIVSESGSEDAQSPLSDEAEHIILVGEGGFSGLDPDGFPEDQTLQYELGDELPFEKAAPHVSKWPGRLAVLDAEGDIIAGAEPAEDSGPNDLSGEALEARRIWRRGDGFDPTDFDPTDFDLSEDDIEATSDASPSETKSERVERYLRENGTDASIREIADDLDVSTGTVQNVKSTFTGEQSGEA